MTNRPSESSRGFTLIELLVSMSILLLIMAVLFGMTQATTGLWRNTSGRIENFQNARAAFEAMTRLISQATLNTYYDYQDASKNWVSSSGNPPQTYARRSDLHFICGQSADNGAASGLLTGSTQQTPITHAIFFQAPSGRSTLYPNLKRLLNACGFYLVYGPDLGVPSYLSSYLPVRRRFRLMQFSQVAESLQVYQTTAGNGWFTTPIVPAPDPSMNSVLAENIVALVIWPKYSAGDQAANGNVTLTTNYNYDTRASASPSTNQLPPIVEVSMVAIDEASAIKMGNSVTPPSSASTATLFLQTVNFQQDLATLEASLTAAHANFRVSQTEVAIGGAKWSTN